MPPLQLESNYKAFGCLLRVLCSGAAEQELGDVTGGDGATLSSLLQTMLEQLLLPHLRPLREETGGATWRITIDVIVSVGLRRYLFLPAPRSAVQCRRQADP